MWRGISRIGKDVRENVMWTIGNEEQLNSELIMASPSGHSLASQVLASCETAKLGWLSLNTDGVVSGVDGLASDGGVIRDLNGQWIAGFVANFRKAYVEVAEFKALLEGLRLARSLGLKNVFVQSDNCSVVKSINGVHVDSSVSLSMLLAVKKLINFD
ncbi:hypothetical protein GH714_033114 [Hevea brasiliensis]|uniref:RNase H type-1 domain-containing protein n=1 Tax=Hevea brasiliensis TaxID=3981 RepID=A0A6A6NDC0_HEVBR|nr:hypothetical protein GH714_033114 [Hevea brasiliensis]